MGVLVSCCLRLMGYDNLGGAAVVQTSRRKQELNAILSDRDGRRPTLSRQGSNVALDSFSRQQDQVGSADAGLSGELGPPSPLGSMPRGYRDDGTLRDQKRPRPHFLDSLGR